jgi:molybdate transport system substrate-binding protein
MGKRAQRTLARMGLRVLLVPAGLILISGVFVSSCGGTAASDGQEPSAGASPVELVVSAAADLSPVLAELTPLFEEEYGLLLKTNLGSTGQLMEQIAAGARVDVFLAASTSAIDQLSEKDLLVPGSTQLYGRGRLVMWTRPESDVAVNTLEDLAGAEVARISIANPDHAPYGKAAREALESAGLWDQLQSKIVPAENVRQAFQFAETGNVDVGLVALSLVVNAGGTYALVPEDLHQPINQALAIIASSTHQTEAEQFVAFLTGSVGREILLKYGFVLPEEG